MFSSLALIVIAVTCLMASSTIFATATNQLSDGTPFPSERNVETSSGGRHEASQLPTTPEERFFKLFGNVPLIILNKVTDEELMELLNNEESLHKVFKYLKSKYKYTRTKIKLGEPTKAKKIFLKEYLHFLLKT